MTILKYCQVTVSRTVVACSFVTPLEHLNELLQSKGVNVFMYNGKCSASRRAKLLKVFHSTDNGVLLLTKGSGGCGLNLNASAMFVLDPFFYFAMDLQVVKRVVRLRQKHDVSIYWMRYEGGMDSDMWIKEKATVARTTPFSPHFGRFLTEVFEMNTDDMVNYITETLVQDEAKRQ